MFTSEAGRKGLPMDNENDALLGHYTSDVLLRKCLRVFMTWSFLGASI